MIGMILGNRYEILKEIGNGGMANVYLAHCRLLNRNVAVKILKPEFANDKEFLERFNKEAQAAAAIQSPNIVNVYDVGHDGDIHYIVMEYVEGQTLKEYIDANGMLSWQETVEYAIQICSALDKAHKNGVIHRDIKPQNIILTNDGILKVTDFGIARASSNETMNMGESTMGSVHYFSPEQARGGYTDAKSDIYSLGIVMYELVTGILPFNGDTPIAIAIKHMQQKPVSPKEFNISIPLSVEKIILKAMSKEQHLRYQSAEEMLADLNRVMQQPDGIPEDVTNVAGATDGNTIKFDPITDVPDEKPKEQEIEITVPAHRPVHNDKKETAKKDKKQKNKSDSKGVKKAVLLAVATAFALFGLVVILAVSMLGGCSKEVEIPTLVGMEYEKAVEQYKGKFTITIEKEVESDEYPAGYIVDQSPEGGRTTKSRKEIKVTISKDMESFTMRNFVNSTVDDLERILSNELKEYDVKLDVVGEENSEFEKDKIIKTIPKEGEKVKQGDTIIIYVSSGNLVMPELIGFKLGDVKKILSDNGLSLGSVKPSDADDNSVVIWQSTDPDEKVEKGTRIDVEVRSESGGTVGNNQKSKVITVLVPQDTDSTIIRVVQDGNVIHNRAHNKSEGSVDITITGSGTSRVEIYFDGTLENSMTVEL